MTGAEERLEALETALAHAEAAVQDLSDVARAQAAEIEALRIEQRRLLARLDGLEAALDDGAPSHQQF